MALTDTSRRQFFTQLFGAVAPTAAVALYPVASLGLLERFFWKPLRTYFLPPRCELDFDAINEAFKRLYAEGLADRIPEFTVLRPKPLDLLFFSKVWNAYDFMKQHEPTLEI